MATQCSVKLCFQTLSGVDQWDFAIIIIYIFKDLFIYLLFKTLYVGHVSSPERDGEKESGKASLEVQDLNCSQSCGSPGP